MKVTSNQLQFDTQNSRENWFEMGCDPNNTKGRGL